MARSRLSRIDPHCADGRAVPRCGPRDRPSAADGIPNAFDDVIELVKEIATAVVRLLIAVGAGLFILGVVRGAFDGLLGTTLGNVFTSTDGVYRAIGALAAFAILAGRRGLLFQLRGVCRRPFPQRRLHVSAGRRRPFGNTRSSSGDG